MICSMMRSIFLRFASALRGAIATMDASFDDGKRSAMLSPDVWRTMACRAARYSSRCLHRLPTEHRSTMSLMSLAPIPVRFTAAPDAAAADTSRTSRATSTSRTRRNERTRAAVRSSCVSSLRELAPPLAVWGRHDVPAAEAERLGGAGQVAVGERQVLSPEDLLRGLRRRGDHGGHLAEPELHDGAVRPGQLPHHAVHALARRHQV
ncbi:Os07g0218832, partial [Oryza sativa Japonica Group]